jgi:hypothetical protein
LDLYRTVKELPSTSTVAIIEHESGIMVNGPLNGDMPHLLTASDALGQQLMVKILRLQPDMVGVTNKQQANAIAHEAEMVGLLGLNDPLVPFVSARIEVIEIAHDAEVMRTVGSASGSFRTLIMPRYVSTVAKSPKFSPHALVIGARRIVSALEFMHSKGVVHLDVKGDNVFVNQAGEWFLGDFGSSRYFSSGCEEHKVVTSSTMFYPSVIIGKDAHPKYDWYMLCVLLCLCSALSNALDLTDQFDIPVNDMKIRAYVKEMGSSELGVLLQDLLSRHDGT